MPRAARMCARLCRCGAGQQGIGCSRARRCTLGKRAATSSASRAPSAKRSRANGPTANSPADRKTAAPTEMRLAAAASVASIERTFSRVVRSAAEGAAEWLAVIPPLVAREAVET